MCTADVLEPPGARRGDAGPRWAGVEWPLDPIDGDAELSWLDDALHGRERAVVWSAPRGLVAPLSYRRHAGLDAACTAFAAAGWPVRLRRSGGGVVPQGPGVLSLSLAYRAGGAPGSQAEPVYAHLCTALSSALAWLGIDARPRAVHGSFCDGRFNLAVGERKIAGTAQYWRRAGDRHAVLAHAVLLFDADTELLNAQANAFEAALGSGRRYEADTLTTVAREWRAAHRGESPPHDLVAQLRRHIAAALAA